MTVYQHPKPPGIPEKPPWWPDQFPWPPGGGGTGGGGGDTPTTPGTPSGGLNSGQQSAFDAMYAMLAEFGLSSLGGLLQNLIVGGTTDSASLMLALQGTNEWKQRFAGNEQLRANGLGVLSPAEYLAMERSYAQVMKNFGLPPGFYDDPSDFAKWIGHNVSVNELQQRMSSYADLTMREDSALVDQLNSMGLSRGDMLAFFVDPDRALPLLQQQLQTAYLGSASRRAGVVADNSYLSQLAARGVSEDQASQGYGLIAGSLVDANTLSGVYGEDYGLNDMQAEVFDNSGSAQKKRKKLASRERASFSGASGLGRMNQDTSGSY